MKEYEGTELGQITIAELVTHRSGTIVDLETEEEEELLREIGHENPQTQRLAFVEKLSRKKLQCPHGTQFGYSNAGYALLSAVLERHMKQSWEDAVMSLVAIPLGMTSLRFGMPETTAGHDEDGCARADYKVSVAQVAMAPLPLSVVTRDTNISTSVSTMLGPQRVQQLYLIYRPKFICCAKAHVVTGSKALTTKSSYLSGQCLEPCCVFSELHPR